MYARYVLVGIDLHDLVFLKIIGAHLAEISQVASAFDRTKESGYFEALSDISYSLGRDAYYIRDALEAARKSRKLIPMLYTLSQEHRIWEEPYSRADLALTSEVSAGFTLEQKLGLITVINLDGGGYIASQGLVM